MKTFVLRLERYDDVTSIRDKMSWSKAARILLAFPRRRIPILKTLDLNLIQREAIRLGGQLALVTRDSEILGNAEALGIPVFSSISEAQRLPWSRPRQKRHIDPHESNFPELLERREEFRLRTGTTGSQWLRISVFILAIVGIFALILFFIPTATITIKQKSVQQSLSLKLWVNPRISESTASGGVPAQKHLITVEGGMDGKASSITTVVDTKAEGKLTLVNMTESEVFVPAGTVFLSGTTPSIRFASSKPVTVPEGIGQTAEVTIRAISAGINGNVAENTIQAVEGSIGLLVNANNPQATSGGSDLRVQAASEQDYNQLYDLLYTNLCQIAIEKMKTAAGAEQVLIPGSLKLEKTLQDQRQPALGEPADTIHLTLQLEFSALSVNISDIEQAIRLALDASLPVGYTSKTDRISTEGQSIPVVDNDGNIRWNVKAFRMITPEWDIAQTLKLLAGQPVSHAAAILAQQSAFVNDPEISIFPSFWRRLPYLPFRIHVVER